MISICIIVKNDQENLKRCLKHLQPYPFEIVVVDTGSEDQTVFVAREVTDKVYEFPWCNDFSAARNYAISKASQPYVLMIDSDEFVTNANIEEIKALILKYPNQVGRIHRYNVFSRNQTEFTGHEYVNRLFAKELFHYAGKIHEQVVSEDGQSYGTYELPMDVYHGGYDGSFEERKKKSERNIHLLLEMLEENNEDTYVLYQLGKSYYFQEDYQKAVEYFSKALEYDLDPNLEYVIDMVESYGYALVNAGYQSDALGLEGVYAEFEASADFVYMMGYVYMENARFEEAISQYLKATTYSSCKVEGVNSYLAFYNAGVIHECLGRKDKALQCYERCKEYPPALEAIKRYQECGLKTPKADMIEVVKELINQEKYSEARVQLELYKETIEKYDDVLAILEATLYMHEGNWQEVLFSIQEGLRYNPRNYELYYILGNYYAPLNVNQAYLCYENAVHYCQNQDLEFLQQQMEEFKNGHEVKVAKVAIVILSYNSKEITKQCIESIRNNVNQTTYELIVIDNASTDGSVDYLNQQNDMKLLFNEENKGFPAGCNQGIRMAEVSSDVLLLNSDTIVPENSIFWLRMGLYEGDLVGATGSVSNNVTNYQRIIDEGVNDKNCGEIALKYNIPLYFPYEEKSWLVGFALLLKRSVLDEVGLLDEIFSPGNYEDIDLGFRIALAGYRQLLCLNSFIFHYGSTGFNKNREKYIKLLETNLEKFIMKWGIDPIKATRMDQEIINLVKQDSQDEFRLLSIGCGCGATLARLRRLYPYAEFEAIESDPKLARIASASFPVICLNTLNMEEIKPKEQFDYIIIGGTLEHVTNPHNLLSDLQSLLGEQGVIIGKVYNLMFAPTLSQLLAGKLSYQESGIFQKAHVHFYTLEEILQLAIATELKIKDFYYTTKQELYTELCYKQLATFEDILGKNKELLKAYQFYFSFDKCKAEGEQSKGLGKPLKTQGYPKLDDNLDAATYYSMERKEVISLIIEKPDAEFSVLEIGCGSGATLHKIKERYPKARVYGIELNKEVVSENPYQLDLIAGNIEQMELTYEKASFDYIIFADVLEHLYDPEGTLKKVKPYLKSYGHIISSIPNLLHSSVIIPLLHGRFSYRSSGILDRTHLRFFTANEIKQLLVRSGYEMDQLFYTSGEEDRSIEATQLTKQLCSLPGVVGEEQFHAFQFIVKCHHEDRLPRQLKVLEQHFDLPLANLSLDLTDKLLSSIASQILAQRDEENKLLLTYFLNLSKRYYGKEIYKAFLLLSFVLKELKYVGCIPLLIDLAMQKEFRLLTKEKYYVMCQIQMEIVRFSNLDTKETQELMNLIYQDIFHELVEKYQDRLHPIPKEDRNKTKVIVMTDQFLKEQHAPTHSALERSFYLQKDGGKQIKIVNTLGISSTKGEILWWKYYIGSEFKDYNEWTHFSYKGEEFEFWQAKNDLFDVNGISTILDMVREEKPTYIINIGGRSIIADLCSKIVPTVALATAFSRLPVTLGTFSLIGKKLTEYEWREILSQTKQKESIRELPFTFELQEQSHTFQREDYKIPQDAFVLVIVGTRLTQEIDDEFIRVMEQTYERGTHLVFIGVFDNYEAMCKLHPGLKEHSSYVGYCHDMLAMMELCDLYVNPRRLGGGFSIIEAFHQGVPGVSLSYGDVAVAAGEEFCVASYDEMVREICHYQSDSEYYQQKSRQARMRAQVMTNGAKLFIECMESIEKSPLFF